MENLPHNFDAAYLSYIKEQKVSLEQALISGRAGTYEDYKFMVGQYRGLCVAENNFKELVEKWENR